MLIASIVRATFAVTLIGLGTLGLFRTDFARAWNPVPAAVRARELFPGTPTVNDKSRLHSLTSERPYTALVFSICVASRPELAEIGVPTKRRQSRFERPDANPCSPSPPKPLHD